jgi:uncharacterized protein (DUF2147 family)
MIRHLAAPALVALLAMPANAMPAIDGRWLTPGGKSIVEIAPCNNGKRCGRIAWLRDHAPDGGLLRDAENHDPALRHRPVLGIELLAGFRSTPAGVWRGGRIYNPEDGRTYSAQLRRTDSRTLEVKGCALSIFCRTQQWTLVNGQ